MKQNKIIMILLIKKKKPLHEHREYWWCGRISIQNIHICVCLPTSRWQMCGSLGPCDYITACCSPSPLSTWAPPPFPPISSRLSLLIDWNTIAPKKCCSLPVHHLILKANSWAQTKKNIYEIGGCWLESDRGHLSHVYALKWGIHTLLTSLRGAFYNPVILCSEGVPSRERTICDQEDEAVHHKKYLHYPGVFNHSKKSKGFALGAS